MILDKSKNMAIDYDWRDMPVAFYIFPTITSTVTTWQNVEDLITNEFYLKDHLGSTRAVMLEGGSGASDWLLQEATAYLAYGKQMSLHLPNEQSDEAREKFTTKEFDVEGGMNLDYFGARYYDPEIGRFISTDPMDQFWDSYSYCGGDPVNNVDPDGEDGIPLDALNLMTPTTAASISQTMASGAEMEMEFNLNYGMEAELFAPIAYIPDRAPNIGTLSTTEIPTSGWDIRSSLASASFPGDIPQATLTMPQMPTIEGEPSFGAGHSLLSDNSIASAISGQVHSQLQILGPATHIIMGAVGLGLPGGGEMAAAEDVAKIAALPFKDAGISSRVGKSLEDIAAGVKNFKKDGTVFKNLEGRLPAKPQGYYKEYTVPTPGATNRGAQRIVQGANGETYYTLDHYKNFVQIR